MESNFFYKTPIYLQIREAIYKKIVNGEYKGGDKIPSEENLAKQYGVSRITVNKAIMELVKQEYLTRVHGKGTFVSKIRKEGTKILGLSFYDSITNKGFTVQTKVLEQKMVLPPKEIAKKLGCTVNQSVLKLERIRYVLEVPVVVNIAFFTPTVSKVLKDLDFVEEPLYQAIHKEYGHPIVRAKDVIEANIAKNDCCKWLDVKEGFPVLISNRIAYSERGEVIEVSKSIYRGDQYMMEMEYNY